MMQKARHLTAREQRVENWFEVPMLMVTILLIVTLLVPILLPLEPMWVGIFAFLNLFIWFSFYIELFVKLYVAENKLSGLKRNWFLVIIALAPLFLSFRLVRIGRLVSLLRLLGFQRHLDSLRKQVRELVYSVEKIIISLGIFAVLAALMMWQVEILFDGSITSLPDALWWAIITITTIGYGDVIPSSNEGRVLGAVVSLLGTVLFMVFVARITTLFVHDRDVESLKRLVKEDIKAHNNKKRKKN